MQEVRIYDRNVETGALELRRVVDVGSGLDNIEIDQKGDLLIGAHPNLLALTALREDPAALSPSQVLRVALAGAEPVVDELYVDRGEQISGVSVAARSGNRLLLGQIFGNGILDCTID
jgi:arylesterase/paraoxonase